MYVFVLFLIVFLELFLGVPVAIAFFSGSFIIILLAQGIESASQLLLAFFERMQFLFSTDSLMSIPLFIFMSFVFQRTLIAQRLLLTLNRLFYHLPGGIAISTILCGALWGATTGLVGPSVIGLGLVSYPLMQKQGYSSSFSLGVIVSAGSLGQIIPPSVSLIIVADLMQVSTNALFRICLFPSVILLLSYLGVVAWQVFRNCDVVPDVDLDNQEFSSTDWKELMFGILPPVVLIALVLGSLFLSIASAKEAASIGSVGIVVLTFLYRKASWNIFKESILDSVRITGMLFAIVMGGVCFSISFEMLNGLSMIDGFLSSPLTNDPLIFMLILVFVCVILGFFMDLVELSYVLIPIALPFFIRYEISPLILGLILGVCIQISYLSPPFGYSLFYIRGIVPASVTTKQIYRGVLPYLVIQGGVLMSILIFYEYYESLNQLMFS